MDDDLRPVPKHELRFDMEHTLRKARSLWPHMHVHGDHNALRPVADAVVQHLALCGIRCFRKPPLPGHDTPHPTPETVRRGNDAVERKP